jgi:hypothetical protein
VARRLASSHPGRLHVLDQITVLDQTAHRSTAAATTPTVAATGYGAEWTGELGTFDISCDSPDTSTGIWRYFDPDGPGPIEVVGSDFTATGSIAIVQLDDTGYEFVVHELVFADGTTFNEFTVAS